MHRNALACIQYLAYNGGGPWLGQTHARMRPFVSGMAYQNYIDPALKGWQKAYYGNNYYGLQQASCGYFGVQPAELSWPEAAFLAGVVNAPTADDPRTNPENARNREVHVVGRLVAVGVLTAAQAKTVLAQNLNLVPEGTGCTS